jgi:Thermophilic glucose-6-phosphate isomerase and related metalloenzymes
MLDSGKVFFDSQNGKLHGGGIIRAKKKMKDLEGVFADEKAYGGSDMEEIVYEVEMYSPVGAIEGGLNFGISTIYPGKVGNEFFMTKGHFHEIRNRAEYYWGIAGTGILLLINADGKTVKEDVNVGTLHYIAGNTAHRLINSGNDKLVVGACWPSDAGHDYAVFKG